MIAIFMLLAPTGYGIITQNWFLATLCVGGMLLARLAWIRDDHDNHEDESEPR